METQRRQPRLLNRMYKSVNNIHFNDEKSIPDVTYQSTVFVGVVLLPNDFTPSDKDVICGRAKKNYYHGTFKSF